MPLLPVADAQARVLALATPLDVEHVALPAAAHRYAAADVAARRTQPASDLSAMDDYVTKPLRRGDLLAAIAKTINPVKQQSTINPAEIQPIFAR